LAAFGCGASSGIVTLATGILGPLGSIGQVLTGGK
jgi:hypothetical protein